MLLGKKQFEQLMCFTASIISFSIAGFIGGVYLTDWKPVVTYLPYYNRKFRKDPETPGC